MKKFVLALGFTIVGAGPILADGLAFEAVAPQGISFDRAANIKAFQESIGPAQLAAMEEQGYKAYGAIAIPVDKAGAPVTMVDFADKAEAEAEVLAACKQQTGGACTVIGYFVPGS